MISLTQMETENKKTVWVERDSFMPVAAVGIALIGGAAALAFAIMRMVVPEETVVTGDRVFGTGYNVLYLIAGVFLVLGAVYMAMTLFAARRSVAVGGLMTSLAGVPAAVGMVCAMAGGFMRMGQYTTVMEILFCVIAIVSAAVVLLRMTGFFDRNKAVFALAALSVVALFCVFLPLITKWHDITDALQFYLPYVAVPVSQLLLVLGTKGDADNAK